MLQYTQYRQIFRLQYNGNDIIDSRLTHRFMAFYHSKIKEKQYCFLILWECFLVVKMNQCQVSFSFLLFLEMEAVYLL